MRGEDATRTHGDRASHAPHVLVLAGSSSCRIALPREGRVVIGRAPDVEICIDDESVSRRHAALAVAGREIAIDDLGSHNGTRVNGERLASTRKLVTGDVVQLGDVALVVYAGGAPGRDVLDAERLRRRFDEEVERAAAYDREVGLILVTGGEPHALPELRPIDLVAELATHTAIVTPELDREAVAALAARLVTGTARRAAIATCPDDGADAGALLATARAALELAAPGAVASTTVTCVDLGDRTTLVADAATLRLAALTRQLAQTVLAVLVVGETGTGKEHVARALHVQGPRAARPFVTLNCAAVQDTLIESELFGYEKGAFSGAAAAKPGLLEVASGGTVFLDEVGELSPAMQAKLLRAIEAKRITRVGSVVERDIDIRIVAATHRDLETEVAAGRFRRDLYYRLGGATIAIPPLRDRPRELAPLVHHFLDDARARSGRPPLAISAGAMLALARYAWPGNVRELRNVLEYAAATVDDAVLCAWHLPPRFTASAGEPVADEPAPPPPSAPPRPLAEELRDLERRRMREAIAAADGVLKEAAALLGMPLRTFHLKAKQYGLRPMDR